MSHLQNIDGTQMEGKLPVTRLSNQPFEVVSEFEPAGDQPEAIEQLAKNIGSRAMRYQTLLGVTGVRKDLYGRKRRSKPSSALRSSWLRTRRSRLSSQPSSKSSFRTMLWSTSFRTTTIISRKLMFPPLIPSSKRMLPSMKRLRSCVMRQLPPCSSRRDVIVVASVSCIYGIGSPAEYAGMAVFLDKEVEQDRDELIMKLIDIQYDRNDYDLQRGTFRVRGDALDIFPPYSDNPLRVEFWDDEIELIAEVDKVTGEVITEFEALPVWPATHYVASRPAIERALDTIRTELQQRLEEFNKEGKLLEAQRLEMRTTYDLEMIETMGFCSGIENYSRHLDGRAPVCLPIRSSIISQKTSSASSTRVT